MEGHHTHLTKGEIEIRDDLGPGVILGPATKPSDWKELLHHRVLYNDYGLVISEGIVNEVSGLGYIKMSNHADWINPNQCRFIEDLGIEAKEGRKCPNQP